MFFSITPENKEINRFRKKQFNNFIQITMPYLAAFIDENKYEITLVDEYNQKIPFKKQFDLAAITVNTSNALHCYNISERLRTQNTRVVMGGPHATLLPEEVKKNCDHILIGEGEQIWPEFLEDFYKGNARTEYICKVVPDLKNLPVPRRDLIKNRPFSKGAVISSRGCPYSCSYCNLKQIYCEPFRTRPVQEVIAEIKAIRSKYFVFWDDNFFGDVKYTKELLEELKKLNKRWAAQVTLDRCRDHTLLKLAKAAGCIYLFVGIESFSQDSLGSVNKGINVVERYKSIIHKIHENGICVQAGIIFGFDTDKKDIFQKTLEACNDLGIDGVTVSILTPLPKTPIYTRLKEENRLVTDDWSCFNGKTEVAFVPRNMSREELFEGYMWFRKEFYSFKSIFARLKKSKTNILHNIIINLGYKLSIRGTKT
ncbi:MAG: radical protein [Eubacterium sp.]|nr:radical protein [Eubacterium sp.]